MNNGQGDKQLRKIRALLDTANDEALTEEARKNYRDRAFDLMAKYGIEQALLDARAPGSDKPADRTIDIPNPWSMEKVRFINRLATALRCELILLGRNEKGNGRQVHVFGYESDLERLELLFTSLLLQMFGELGRTPVPRYDTPRAFRRSWLLGFGQKVGDRVREAEERARAEATTPTTESGRGAAIVLADRKAVIARAFRDAYPRFTSSRTTTTGSGFDAGAAAGARADIGATRINGAGRRSLTR